MAVEIPSLNKELTAVLGDDPRTMAALRQSIAAHAAALSLEQTPDHNAIASNRLPPINLASLYTYKILDRSIDELTATYPGQDQTFEQTISAALGAGLARLERSLANKK